MNLPTFETVRLFLQPLCIEDAPLIQAVFPQWEIVKYLGAQVPWPYPEDGAEQFIRHVAIPAMEAGEAWHWSIRPKSTPHALIGVISLMDKPDENRGFWLDPKWQGQGMMSEAADAVTEYWFGELGKSQMRIPKAIDNLPSRKISQRSNMRIIATIQKQLVCGECTSEVWEITKDEWNKYRSSKCADYFR
jgi:RimJ/RimL family protein N-acetyltransferase